MPEAEDATNEQSARDSTLDGVAGGRKICLLNALMCAFLALRFDQASSPRSSASLRRADRLSLIKVNE
jgi:hypothetical protein